MKKIEAIVRPEKLDLVREALEEKGILGMTVSEVSGRGQQKGVVLAGDYRVELLPKVKLELIVNDGECDLVVDTICQAAQTGKIGAGKIFILPVENAVRVRTGERGLEVLRASGTSLNGGGHATASEVLTQS